MATPFNHSTKTQVERAFSNITKGEVNRTAIEQISEQDFKRLGEDLSTLSPLKIQQQHDRTFDWDIYLGSNVWQVKKTGE